MKCMTCALLLAFVAALGCSDTTTIKTEKTVKTPRGEKTVITEREVKETDNPPARP